MPAPIFSRPLALVAPVLALVMFATGVPASASGATREPLARVAEGSTHADVRVAGRSRTARARPRGRAARVRGTSAAGYSFKRAGSPARTVVSDSRGAWVATFTDAARTVTVAGPERTFGERTAGAPVVSRTWVRMLPAPFNGTVDAGWLDRARTDVSPDILALAVQYIEGAPSQVDAAGVRFAGDASYGPLLADGTREEGSDWNDFLGVTATYGGVADAPETRQLGSLDCSGFVRMVWGRRAGLPLGLEPDGGASLPRRAWQMLASAPGVVTVRDTGAQVTDFGTLAPGDLVFFDAATNDGTQVDHVGTFLGRDTAGNLRFISSRKSIDGPTLGDYAGRSTLNGTGLYASAFRAVRRL